MTRRAWLLMGLLAALWGASYLFIKVALTDLPPAWVVFGRTALGALVLAPVAARRGALGVLRERPLPLLALAVMQIVAPFLLITVGEQHIPSSLAGILVSSSPIFTVLLALRYGIGEEPVRGWGAVGIALGIGGVVLLFGVDLGGRTAALLGGLAVLLASLGYAAGALFLRRRLAGAPPVGVAAATMALSAALLVPALPFAVPHHLGAATVGALAALGAGGTGLAFLIFYVLIADIGAARASVVAYVAPGFAVLYGATVRGERITGATVAGLVLILAGSYLAAEGRLPGRSARRRAVAG